MHGWKAYLGAAIVGGSALLHAFGYQEYASAVEAIGLALGVTGLRAKQERDAPGS